MEYGTYKIVRGSDGRFSSYWKKIKWFSTRVFIGVGVSFLLLGVYVAGQMNQGVPDLVPVVSAEDTTPPVLKRIANCETTGSVNKQASHYGKNGKVLKNYNTNGSIDVGYYQINTVNFLEAMEMGYNVTKEEDNKKYGEWLYANRGTGDWSASAKCWNK